MVSASDDPPESGERRGKNSIYGVSRSNILLEELSNAGGSINCIERCVKENQIASVGFEAIQEQCRLTCYLEDILKQVQSQDTKKYNKGVNALCKIDDPRATQPLITALKKDLEVRTGLWACIIPALGRLRDPATTPILEHALNINDDHWPGREMSAIALGNIGASSSIPALLKAVERGYVRKAVFEALTKFDDQRIIPALITTLQPEENMETTREAMNALHRFGPEAVPAIIDAFDNFSPEYTATEERLKMCHLLGKSGDERAIKRLQESLNDPDAIIKKCALEYVSNT